MSVLSNEIANDPLARGYAGMTDVQVAADLNTAYRSKYKALSTRDLLRWGFGREGLSKLRDAADKAGAFTGITDANRARALSAYTIMTQGIDGSLDLNDPVIDNLMDQLIAASIFVAQDKVDLQTDATGSISRAAELNLRVVREGDVQMARS